MTRGAMRTGLVALLVLVVSCDAGSSTGPTSIDAMFSLDYCTTGGFGAVPPCLVHASGAGSVVVDSGRVVLRPDNTVSWMVGTTTQVTGPCGTTACDSFVSRVDARNGTYEFIG